MHGTYYLICSACIVQRDRLEKQWSQSAAALLLELPKGQHAYTVATFDRYMSVQTVVLTQKHSCLQSQMYVCATAACVTAAC